MQERPLSKAKDHGDRDEEKSSVISRFPSKRGLQPKPPAPAPAPAPAPRSSQLAAPDVTLTIRRSAAAAPAGDSEHSDLAERGREAGASEAEEQKEQIYESLNTFHQELTVAKLESKGPNTTTTTTSAPSSDNLYAKVKKLSGNSGSNNTNHTNNNLNSEFMSIYELTKVETTNETSQPEESRVDNKIISQINNCELINNEQLMNYHLILGSKRKKQQ